MNTSNKFSGTVFVKVENPDHCIILQNKGWTIGTGGRLVVFGWKRPHEVTKEDRNLFKIR